VETKNRLSRPKGKIFEAIPGGVGPRPEFVLARGLFSANQCEMLLSKTRFYRNDSQYLARRVDISYLKPDKFAWVFEKVESAATNKNVWGLTLSAITESIRIQRYRRRDFSDLHSDYDYPTVDHSKLTVVVPLIDPKEWQGGALEIGNSGVSPRWKQGDAVIFPSFILHRVTRVTKGTRIILSAWISGPPLR
jgi:PKHD-type hydroxylase